MTSLSTTPNDDADPFWSKDYILEDDEENSERNPFVSRKSHTRRCPMKKSTSVADTIGRVVNANKSLLASSDRFVRRPHYPSCDTTNWNYTIVLSSSTVECAGCNKSIRSTNHKCFVYDIFTRGEWLGRHQKPIYDSIRRKNFMSLAEQLPYTLPTDVLDSSNERTPSCQSLEFLERV